MLWRGGHDPYNPPPWIPHWCQQHIVESRSLFFLENHSVCIFNFEFLLLKQWKVIQSLTSSIFLFPRLAVRQLLVLLTFKTPTLSTTPICDLVYCWFYWCTLQHKPDLQWNTTAFSGWKLWLALSIKHVKNSKLLNMFTFSMKIHWSVSGADWQRKLALAFFYSTCWGSKQKLFKRSMFSSYILT